MIVIKKNGNTEAFNSSKLYNAIEQAMKIGSGIYHKNLIKLIVDEITEEIEDEITHTELDQKVLHKLKEYGQDLTANSFERYKTTKHLQKQKGILDNEILGIIRGTNNNVISENSNKDARLMSTQKDLISGAESRSIAERYLIPTHILQAHREGLLHLHDTDYMIHPVFNCMLIDLENMLERGTVINGKMIETPKSLQTAATVATQISLQVANSQYGGQTINISHLAPYVRVSYEKHKKQITDLLVSEGKLDCLDTVEALTMQYLKEEIKSAVQTIQFQENTFSSNNGQTPFVSIFMYLNDNPEYVKETAMLIEEMLNLRYKGMKNEYGVYVTPAFPKLLYVLDDNNLESDSEYGYLTALAEKCAAKRMNPDFMSAKIMRNNYEGNVYGVMGCRSALSPWKDKNGQYKFWGRYNRGVVTLNLVDIALSAKKDMNKFWAILDERLELCKEALILRHNLIKQHISPDSSPIHWKYGAVGRFKSSEEIIETMENGYSTISLGYIGLHEMCQAMLGLSNTTRHGEKFALDVLKYLKTITEQWKRTYKELAGCGLYGTPSESLCYKFATKTASRFGVIKNVTDKDWFTNSYHVCVTEEIYAFNKLTFESAFQNLSTGGAVSYVEVPNMEDNLEALHEIVKHIYNTILYAEINTRNGDSCGACGFEGEIEANNEGVWTCPKCSCQDKTKLTVVRRTCGYLGSNFWNHGKTMEIKDRVYHI